MEPISALNFAFQIHKSHAKGVEAEPRPARFRRYLTKQREERLIHIKLFQAVL